MVGDDSNGDLDVGDVESKVFLRDRRSTLPVDFSEMTSLASFLGSLI